MLYYVVSTFYLEYQPFSITLFIHLTGSLVIICLYFPAAICSHYKSLSSAHSHSMLLSSACCMPIAICSRPMSIVHRLLSVTTCCPLPIACLTLHWLPRIIACLSRLIPLPTSYCPPHVALADFLNTKMNKGK